MTKKENWNWLWTENKNPENRCLIDQSPKITILLSYYEYFSTNTKLVHIKYIIQYTRKNENSHNQTSFRKPIIY